MAIRGGMRLMAQPSPGVAERVAWRLSGSTRRFFGTLAIAVVIAIVLASATAVLAAVRNAQAIADARHRGLRVATSVTQFRNHLSLADIEVATTLISGEEASPLGRARYETELLNAGLSLTDAGLVATGRSADDIAALAEGLVRYARLVDTSRAYPAGSTFTELAQALVRDELVPTAESVRVNAEEEVARTDDRVADPLTTIGIAGLMLALLALIVAAALVAGRTRIRLHPAFVIAATVLIVDLAIVTPGLWSQRQEVRAAAAAEIDSYEAANFTAFSVFNLRTTEMQAVSSDDAADLYAKFRSDATSLVMQLEGDGPEPEPSDTLLTSVREYIESVAGAERLHRNGNLDAAAAVTLDGAGSNTYRMARERSLSTVNRSSEDLTERLDRAAAAGVAWGVPLALGVGAAGLAALGVRQRGRDWL